MVMVSNATHLVRAGARGSPSLISSFSRPRPNLCVSAPAPPSCGASSTTFHQNLFIMRLVSKVITFSSAMVMLVNNKSESQIFRESLECFFSLWPNKKSDDHGGSDDRVRVAFNMQDSKLERKIARVNAQTENL